MKNIYLIKLFLLLCISDIYPQLSMHIDSVFITQECYGFNSKIVKIPFLCINARWTLKNISDSIIFVDYPAYIHSEEVKPKCKDCQKTFAGFGNSIIHLTKDSLSFKENNCCIEAPPLEVRLRKLKPNEKIMGELSGRYYDLETGCYTIQLEYTTEYQKNMQSYWRGTLLSNQKRFCIDPKKFK